MGGYKVYQGGHRLKQPWPWASPLTLPTLPGQEDVRPIWGYHPTKLQEMIKRSKGEKQLRLWVKHKFLMPHHVYMSDERVSSAKSWEDAYSSMLMEPSFWGAHPLQVQSAWKWGSNWIPVISIWLLGDIWNEIVSVWLEKYTCSRNFQTLTKLKRRMISSSEHRYHETSSVPTQGFYYSKLFWYFKQKNWAQSALETILFNLVSLVFKF